MQENGLEPGSSEPSLDELRRMMEERACEKERERKRRSGMVTKILVVAVLVVVVGIWCSPDRESSAAAAEGLDPEKAAMAARIQAQFSGSPDGGGVNAEHGTADGDAPQGDLKFAMDLIRYVQPELPLANPPATKDAGGQ